MLKKVLLTAILITAFSSVANAANYGSAGCGLGSVLFGDEPGLIQILAATTNVVSGNQTFGMTSGTLNCGKSGIAGINQFIANNRTSLENDIARGNGETLNSLSSMLGCKNSSKLGNELQSKYQTIFPSEKVSSDNVTDTIITTIKSDKSLSCSGV